MRKPEWKTPVLGRCLQSSAAIFFHCLACQSAISYHITFFVELNTTSKLHRQTRGSSGQRLEAFPPEARSVQQMQPVSKPFFPGTAFT